MIIRILTYCTFLIVLRNVGRVLWKNDLREPDSDIANEQFKIISSPKAYCKTWPLGDKAKQNGHNDVIRASSFLSHYNISCKHPQNLKQKICRSKIIWFPVQNGNKGVFLPIFAYFLHNTYSQIITLSIIFLIQNDWANKHKILSVGLNKNTL